MAKVSANSPESMFSDESKVFRVLVYKPCTRYFVSQSIIRGNKTTDKEDDDDDYDDDDGDDDYDQLAAMAGSWYHFGDEEF